jgi:sugar lactone lactonase YvrE
VPRLRRLPAVLLPLLAFAPGSLPAQDADLVRLEGLHARDPQDAVVLFNLAAAHAAAGHRAEALAALMEMSRAPGGLDPGFYRGFFFLHADATFRRIVADIRAAHPPLVHGAPAFVIPERDLQPEGIAFDPCSRALFAGSFKGKIVRVDPDGSVTDFAAATEPGVRRVVVGLRVDPLRRQLWAVVDDPRAFADPALGGAALHRYSLDDGRLLARYPGPPTGALNDVAVLPDGMACATGTSDGSLWCLRPDRPRMEEFLPPGTIPEANGLVAGPDGRTLYVAGWHDIHRVDLASRVVRTLPAPPGFPTGSFDGLYWYRGGLVGIQNGIHPGRVVWLRLDAPGDRIVEAEVLERYHPLFNGMTTGALDGDSFLYIANTQSRAFRGDGTPIDPAALADIVILRLALAPDGAAPPATPRGP